MDHTLDIFEILTDGTPRWRGSAENYGSAVRQMETLAEESSSEFRVIRLPDRLIVAKKLGRIPVNGSDTHAQPS